MRYRCRGRSSFRRRGRAGRSRSRRRGGRSGLRVGIRM